MEPKSATRYAPALDVAFSRSISYRNGCPGAGMVREPGRSPSRAFPFSERHVQCVWYDPACRPSSLHSHDGETIQVDDPGVWNLEAGPDFLGAAIRVGPRKRLVRGDVEVHIGVGGWEQHGHRNDPRYQDVRFHVTWFPGFLPPEELPKGAFQISLLPEVQADPSFSLDSIDITAYPYAARAQVPPCSEVFRDMDPDRKQAVLIAAGEERLRRKSERLAERIDRVGAEQALYEEVFAALGYKHNKNAFRTLATRVPVQGLREASAHDIHTACAILMGVAGLLPDQISPQWDDETRAMMRETWTRWWKVKSDWEPHAIRRSDWRLAGIRPTNHPRRRIVAAAHLFHGTEPLSTRLLAGLDAEPARFLQNTFQLFAGLSDDYWSHRLGLQGKRKDAPIALLGRTRIHSIITNVVLPVVAAAAPSTHITSDLLDQLPAEDDNLIIRQTAHHLFGPDHPRSLYATTLQRQGLLQIFHDFCLNDRSRCATCSFPQALRSYQAI